MMNEKLKGNAVYLRPITIDNTDLIVKWRNSDSVRKHFIFRETFTKEMHIIWMNTKVTSGQVIQYIICSNNDVPIGSIYFRDINNEKKEADFGIFIGEETATGKGYGYDAILVFVKKGFEMLNLKKIVLRVIGSNGRAIHVYENIGFKGVRKEIEIS